MATWRTHPAEYAVWSNMMQRCSHPNASSYERYGARGIRVCRRWHKFSVFFADMGERPSPDHSIERDENEAGYGPDNCRWATRKEQARNRRSTHLVDFRGRQMSLMEATELAGLPYHAVKKRIRRGWSPQLALTEPMMRSA